MRRSQAALVASSELHVAKCAFHHPSWSLSLSLHLLSYSLSKHCWKLGMGEEQVIILVPQLGVYNLD